MKWLLPRALDRLRQSSQAAMDAPRPGEGAERRSYHEAGGVERR